MRARHQAPGSVIDEDKRSHNQSDTAVQPSELHGLIAHSRVGRVCLPG